MAVVDIIGTDLQQNDIRRELFDIITALHCFEDAVQLAHPAAGQISNRIAAVSCVIVIIGNLLTVIVKRRGFLALRADKINVVMSVFLQELPHVKVILKI